MCRVYIALNTQQEQHRHEDTSQQLRVLWRYVVVAYVGHVGYGLNNWCVVFPNLLYTVLCTKMSGYGCKVWCEAMFGRQSHQMA